ncbi:chemotaxis protein CheW [Cohnella abietis]|uniref:CheW-like domain-containing protein n=1 Tax=Cohnella abietis TaxID=2507935 RepID=A0A3T1DBJ6_9BACL|nr:chemotaxis protein CheW [Cohnella abietis]BBI35506.1 hypothetical protein KCTCHS21_49050 [Cohnella abietis]
MGAVKHEQYIEIGIEQERYAVRINEIQEVIRWQDPTRLPGNNSYIKGVINLRGKIVPIMSLSLFLGIAEGPCTKSTRIVIFNFDDERVGMIVDRVIQVVTLTDIQPHVESGSRGKSSWIAGYGHTATGLVCILKSQRIFWE